MINFCADPHLGHRNIYKFRDSVSSTEDNTAQFIDEAELKLHKNGITFFLGDVAFNDESLSIIDKLKGRKVLIKGNHDDLVSTKDQSLVFNEIYGLFKYKKFWLSHAPIHPAELRGKVNLHGHVHSATVKRFGMVDKRYLNLCPDVTGQYFTSLDEVRRIRRG
jgi:calcineurin-like phosphoesterase family protein